MDLTHLDHQIWEKKENVSTNEHFSTIFTENTVRIDFHSKFYRKYIGAKE